MQCNEITILTDSFVLLHTLLFWLRIEVVDPFFILNNELWNKFFWVTSVSFEKFFRNLCAVLLIAFLTPSDRHFVHMHKIFIAQKSHCACHVLKLATIRRKHYINFILNRTRRTFWSPLVLEIRQRFPTGRGSLCTVVDPNSRWTVKHTKYSRILCTGICGWFLGPSGR